MDDRLYRLERRVEEITGTLARIERRLSELEERSGQKASPPAVEPGVREPETIPPPLESDLAVALSRIGRTVLALGGGYLLRAFTEAGVVHQGLGVSLGAAYACLWIFFAHRAGSRGESTNALFHAGAAVLVGYPLLWEATVRLRLLGAPSSALAIVGFSLALLAVAGRGRLRSTAWMTEIAGAITAFALMGGTRSVLPYAFALVALGIASLALGYLRDWSPLQWVSGAIADLSVMLLAAGALIQEPASLGPALWAPLFLFVGYVSVFYQRHFFESRASRRFELLQASAAALLGYGGAVAIAWKTAALWVVVPLGIAAAAACYAALLREKDELLFGSLALVIALLTALPLPGREYLLPLLALGAFGLGSRLERPALSLHGGAFLLAAGVASGLFSKLADAFVLDPSSPWPALSLPLAIVFFAALVAMRARVPERDTFFANLPTTVALLVAASGAGVTAMRVLVPLVEETASGTLERGVLAALRSAVLAATAMGLGALAGRTRLREARWLLYPLLVFSGIKLVVEDFPHGRAETLFVGLACYGAALVLSPRLARSGR